MICNMFITADIQAFISERAKTVTLHNYFSGKILE